MVYRCFGSDGAKQAFALRGFTDIGVLHDSLFLPYMRDKLGCLSFNKFKSSNLQVKMSVEMSKLFISLSIACWLVKLNTVKHYVELSKI